MTTRDDRLCPDGIRGAWDRNTYRDEQFSVSCAGEAEEDLSPTVDPDEEFTTPDLFAQEEEEEEQVTPAATPTSTTATSSDAPTGTTAAPAPAPGWAMESRKEREEDRHWCKEEAEGCWEITHEEEEEEEEKEEERGEDGYPPENATSALAVAVSHLLSMLLMLLALSRGQ